MDGIELIVLLLKMFFILIQFIFVKINEILDIFDEHTTHFYHFLFPVPAPVPVPFLRALKKIDFPSKYNAFCYKYTNIFFINF